MMRKLCLLPVLFMFAFAVYGQHGPLEHNVVDGKRIVIKDSATAVAMVEPLLFSIYGRNNILAERPYQAFYMEHYWVITGTLPEDAIGGTFYLILDARNGEIVRLTHGK